MKRLIGIAALAFLLFYAATHEVNLPFQNKTEKPVEKISEPKPQPKSDPKEEARFLIETSLVRRLKAAMNDPSSFQLEKALRMSDGTLCLTYRARNGFNALMLSQAVIGQHRSMTSDQYGFAEFWNRHCGGKLGDDITYIGIGL